MKYIDRRLLFPVAAAATVWAQQPAPAVAEAEAALRARVEQFYQLQADKKFRQAEAFVAEDTKDDYYNGSKPDIKGFSIERIELLDATHAQVTVKRKMLIRGPYGNMDVAPPSVNTWKVENGQWVWYIEKSAPISTPFGPVARSTAPQNHQSIDLATLSNPVQLDRTSVMLSQSSPEQVVTVSNKLPGAITLKLDPAHLEGFVVELEKTELKEGETSAIRFQLIGSAGVGGVVRLTALPLNKVFEISVQSK